MNGRGRSRVSTREAPGTQAPAPPGPGPGTKPSTKPAPRRAFQVSIVVVLMAVAAILAAFVVTNLRISGRPALSTKNVNAIVNEKVSSAISQLQSQPSAAATAYGAVRGGLVVIEAQGQGTSSTGDLGAGVIIDTRGDILTALHVVQGAKRINVAFYDGTTSTASIKASDPADDIAVLTSVHLPRVVQPAVLGSSPQIGDEVFAVGNPLGLDGSISAGVVSGLDRTFKVADGRTLSGMIQFDAAVDPGSSGGPLLNTKGQVIGIVTGLANPAGIDEFAGIGFAVPIAVAGAAAGAPAK
jgi:S1-C subfamily serine protease